MANGTLCSEATRWYARMRAICGSTRELLLLGRLVTGLRFSITRRHFEQQSGSSEDEDATTSCVAAEVDDADDDEEERKKIDMVCCFVVSAVRRHAKQRTLTLPPSSLAWRSFFFLLAICDEAVSVHDAR